MSLLVSLLLGCGQAPTEASIELEAPTAAPVPDGRVRGWRRMDLAQLDTSIRRVTGGIGWDVNGESQFEVLSDTLGAADFLSGQPESLEVSVLFLKFLEDAAGHVCTALIEREAAAETTEEEVPTAFFVHASASDSLASNPDAVEANLQYLLLQYHGRSVDPRVPPARTVALSP